MPMRAEGFHLDIFSHHLLREGTSTVRTSKRSSEEDSKRPRRNGTVFQRKYFVNI